MRKKVMELSGDKLREREVRNRERRREGDGRRGGERSIGHV